MDRKAGLWIDHEKAVLVWTDGANVSTKTVLSNAGKRTRAKGGTRSGSPYGPKDVTNEGRRDRRYEKRLREYYDQVISEISGAESLFIMGPGEARDEFRKRLEGSGTPAGSVSTAVSDKLTEAQVVEMVKKHYGYATRQSL